MNKIKREKHSRPGSERAREKNNKNESRIETKRSTTLWMLIDHFANKNANALAITNYGKCQIFWWFYYPLVFVAMRTQCVQTTTT